MNMVTIPCKLCYIGRHVSKSRRHKRAFAKRIGDKNRPDDLLVFTAVVHVRSRNTNTRPHVYRRRAGGMLGSEQLLRVRDADTFGVCKWHAIPLQLSTQPA